MSRQTSLLLACAVLLLANAFSWWDALRLQNLSTAVGRRAEAAQGEAASVAELRQHLADLQQQIDTQAPFPQNIDNAVLVDHIVRAAMMAQTQVAKLEARPSTTEPVNGHPYAVVTYGVTAYGQPDQLATLVEQLQQGPYRSVTIDRAQLLPLDREWEMVFEVKYYLRSA